MRQFFILLICTLSLFACRTNSVKDQPIPFDKMKVVVLQLMKADELYSRKSITDSSWKNSKKNVQMYQQIFDVNKIDRTQFYKQIGLLETHPIEFKELIDSVEQLSKREKNTRIP
jgi:hypothetical protein